LITAMRTLALTICACWLVAVSSWSWGSWFQSDSKPTVVIPSDSTVNERALAEAITGLKTQFQHLVDDFEKHLSVVVQPIGDMSNEAFMKLFNTTEAKCVELWQAMSKTHHKLMKNLSNGNTTVLLENYMPSMAMDTTGLEPLFLADNYALFQEFDKNFTHDLYMACQRMKERMNHKDEGAAIGSYRAYMKDKLAKTKHKVGQLIHQFEDKIQHVIHPITGSVFAQDAGPHPHAMMERMKSWMHLPHPHFHPFTSSPFSMIRDQYRKQQQALSALLHPTTTTTDKTEHKEEGQQLQQLQKDRDAELELMRMVIPTMFPPPMAFPPMFQTPHIHLDVVETPTEYHVLADVPAGISLDNIHVNVSQSEELGNICVVSMSRQSTHEHNITAASGTTPTVYKERNYGYFKRVFHIPEDVTAEEKARITAKVNARGELEIVMPRRVKAIGDKSDEKEVSVAKPSDTPFLSVPITQ